MTKRAEKEGRRRTRLTAERARAEAARRGERRRWFAAGGGALVVIAAVAALAVSGGANSTATGPGKQVDTRGLPRQLAANARDANKVVDGSIQSKLESLKGVPVVVNQWAAWCPNCRQEFPYFQQLAETYRDQVAFVGLDSRDNRRDAVDFLEDFPVDYPSIWDPAAAQARSIGGGLGWPTTIFYDRAGKRTFVRQGGYATLESLDADIRRFALTEP